MNNRRDSAVRPSVRMEIVKVGFPNIARRFSIAISIYLLFLLLN
jgi:hypothetical protein